MARGTNWFGSLGLSKWYRRNRRSQLLQRHSASRAEVVEERILLTASFTVSFGEVFAGQADNVVNIDLTDSTTGEIDAWLDLDGDGQFHGAQEQILTSVELTGGSNELVFEVPFGAVAANRDVRLTVTTPDPDEETIDTSVNIGVAAVEPELTTHQTIRNLPFLSAITTADFDNDGDVDVFGSNINGSTIHYYRNIGDGHFTTIDPSIDLSGTVQELDAADLNNDGLLDVVVSTSGSTAAIDIFLQTPAGHFNHFEQASLEDADHSEIADFNGDGHLDIITISEDVQLLLNNGSGLFTASTVDTTNAFPGNLATGDVDMDGDIDAIVSHGREIVLYRNDGNGGLTTVDDYITASTSIQPLQVFDFNRDGLNDIVGNALSSGSDTIVFQFDGTSYSESTIGVEGNRDEIELGDVNGDGFIDVVTAGGTDGAEVFINSGDDSNFARITLQAGLSSFVDAADLDGDGDLDFVYELGSDVVWTINTGDSGRIQVDIPADSATESVGTLATTISRPVGSSNDSALLVNLTSSDPTRLTVPTSVTIAAGSDSISTIVTVINDSAVNGDSPVLITAEASGVLDGTDELLVVDNDGVATFTATFDQVFAGNASNVVTVNLPNAASAQVNAWIDFDGDGEFHGVSEQILTSANLVQGDNTIAFEVPFGALAATRDARFTVTTPTPDELTVNTSVDVEVHQIAPELTTSQMIRELVAPSSMTTADFDGDGDVDIFVTNINGSTVHYYRNTGDGEFTTIDTSMNLSGAVQEVDAADLNGDGLLDVVVSVSGSTDAIDLFIQGPAGHFTYAQQISTENADHAEIADFNGDGHLDIITISRDVQLLLNDGTGVFTASTVDTTHAFPGALAVGDVDGDGDIDAIISDSFEIVLYRNDGGGVLTTVDDYLRAPGILTSIDILDFNRDGLLDILGNEFGASAETTLFAFDGVGHTESTLGIPGWRDEIEYGDINGDGFVDAISARVIDGAEIHLNTGDDATFTRITLHTELSEFIDAADLDGDGDLDFVYEQGNDVVWTINDGEGGQIQIDISATSAIEDAGNISTLVSRPPGTRNTSDLVVNLASSDPARATVPASVTIPAGSDSVSTNVTLIDDAVVNGNALVTITAQATVFLVGTDQLLVLDDDGQGITVTETSGFTEVSEAGTTDSFDVVLDVQPESNVILNISSDDVEEATATVATLTFTPANWNTAQVVDITGVNDSFVDGTQSLSIQIDVDPSSDPKWLSLAPVLVGVTNLDDEIASLTITESGSSTTVPESGTTTDTFDVVLDGQPEGEVILNVVSGDIGEATVDTSQLTFNTSNWNLPQTVTVIGVDDFLVDGPQPSNIVVSADSSSHPAWLTASAAVVSRTTDDDTAAFTVTPSSTSSVSESGTTDTYEVVLNAAPVNEVFIRSISGDTGEVVILNSSLTFDSTNWDTPQEVTFVGVDDLIVDGDQTSTLAADIGPGSDAAWFGLATETVLVSTTDDDVGGITTIESNGTTVVSENGSTDTFDVVLSRGPLKDVFIILTSSDTSESTIDVNTLTFTPTNWNSPQTITVSSQDDALVDGTGSNTISISTTGASDPDFTDLAVTVDAQTLDNDAAAFTVTQTGGDTIVGENSDPDTISVVLNRGPLTNVIVDLSDTAGAVNASPTALTFTPENWDTPQAATISGIDNDLVDGTHSDVINVEINPASDAAFISLPSQSVDVDVLDDDIAGFTITETDGDTTVSEQRTTDTFTIVLNAAPISGAILAVSSPNPDEFTVFPERVHFTVNNWNLPKTVTIQGVNDDLVDGATMNDLIVSVRDASDIAFHDVPDQFVTVTNLDNDGNAFVDDDELVVRGTDEDDTVTIIDDGSVLDLTINGETQQFDTADFTRIRLLTFRGDDSVDASGTAVPVFARLFGGNDSFIGGSAKDQVQGGGGRDTLLGNDGDDLLSSGSGSDLIEGHAGNDRLRAGNGTDSVFGGTGIDTLSGGGGRDMLDGGLDNDSLTGGSGVDSLTGGEGDDTLLGGPGGDVLDGGAGNDIVDGENGEDSLNGGDGRDIVIGGLRRDELSGGADEDILLGGTIQLNHEELASVLAEWNSDRSYLQRVSNVRGAADKSDDRLNTAFLTGVDQSEPQTVFSDDEINVISGNDGDDLFFAAVGDDLTDRLDAEWLELL
jgi:Ca2+-binding RTX toxin-like protein